MTTPSNTPTPTGLSSILLADIQSIMLYFLDFL